MFPGATSAPGKDARESDPMQGAPLILKTMGASNARWKEVIW